MSRVALFLASAKSGAGRGLFATRDIEEGETLVHIPEECFIAYGILDSEFPEYAPQTEKC